MRGSLRGDLSDQRRAINYSYTIRPDLILALNSSGTRFHYLARRQFEFRLDSVWLACGLQCRSPVRCPLAVHALLHPRRIRLSLVRKAKVSSPTTTRKLTFRRALLGSEGSHTWVFGGQLIETYDNYAQTNIASGAFAFNGSWTSSNAVPGGTGTLVRRAVFLRRFSAGIRLERVKRVQPQLR